MLPEKFEDPPNIRIVWTPEACKNRLRGFKPLYSVEFRGVGNRLRFRRRYFTMVQNNEAGAETALAVLHRPDANRIKTY
ncbi:hypothetical protein AVEN_156186-1, partial [Araneus ventricosus]